MKHWGKKAVSLLLALTMILTSAPGLTALAAEGEKGVYTLDNGYLTATVNGKNGGFQVKTTQGDQMVKDDDNKNLLFPDGEYDTSFTSVRITRDGVGKDYIFGRSYPAAGSTGVVTTQAEGAIKSVWSVDGITITQTITLAGDGASQHGMARISYDARKQNAAAQNAQVELRILLDTALGYQDYAVYELAGANVAGRVEQEKVLTRGGEWFYDQMFFAYDDYQSPTVTAYTVNASIGQTACVPSKVAFGHWNNLASTVFDFTPNANLTFTNPYNVQYLTADSAYALYFDAAQVASDQDAPVCATYYGVFSNAGVADTATVSVNLSASKSALELDTATDNKEYTDGGKFSITTSIKNAGTGASTDYDRVLVAVYPATGITVYDDAKQPVDGISYAKPYTKIIDSFTAGKPHETTWNFTADVGADSHYRKIEFKVFDISDDPTNGTNPTLKEEDLLGSGSVMLLCPGGDGTLPQVQFTSGSPETVYHQGTRNLFFTATNLGMLNNLGMYDLYAVPNGGGVGRQIPDETDNIKFDQNKGTVHVILPPELDLPVGGYRLEFRSDSDQAPAGRVVTAPALAFSVSSDPKYKNEGYAVVAVVQDSQPANPKDITYSIRAYRSEEEYKDQRGDTEVLFELRGAFELKKTEDTITQAVAVARSGSDPVSINNTFDLTEGSLTVYKTGTEIKVDLDGKLLTSGVGSPVWDGVAGFTTIKDGEDYQLRAYDKSGKPKIGQEGMVGKKAITLLWPSAAGLGQTLAGFVFNFQNAELGIIDGADDAAPKTMVASFRAKMDLGFIIPSSSRGDMKDYQLTPMEQLHLVLCSRQYTADELRSFQANDQAAKEQQKSYGEPGMKVIVDNVLFGGGEFIGFDATVDLALPSYSPALPQMSGTLRINTIGDWAAGFKGKGKMMEMLEMEFELKIKGAPNSGAPVPDKLYFYIAGFTPGINVDGFGVLWIQGGGGGIDKLYDTIFGTSALPPLTILLSVKVAILQIIQARADLSISLRGVGIKLSEGKVAGVQVLNSAQLRFDWYPEFYFLAAVNVSILQIIHGAGYIVVEDDGFFEFYLRVNISLPEDIPLVGGIQVAGADVGANSDKLWGNVYVLGVGLGVTYYWGGSVSFSGVGSGSKPTYPELLALHTAPVYTDPATGRMLYAAVGTNVRFLTVAGGALFANDSSHAITMLDAVERDEYKLTLAAYDGSSVMVSIDFPAENAQAAEQLAREEIRIEDYELKWLQTGTADAPIYPNDPRNEEANAYFHWIETREEDPLTGEPTGAVTSQRASVTVTFSQRTDFGKPWTIKTPKGAEVGLYGVDPLPEVDALTAAVNGKQVQAGWSGAKLDQFESISFYAVDSAEKGEDVLVYKVENKPDGGFTSYEATTGAAAFNLPLTLPTGTYTLKAVATKSGELNSVAETKDVFHFTNDALPSTPTGVAVSNAGDHFIQAQVAPSGADFDGYYVNIYEVDENGARTLADGSGMFYPEGQGNTLLTGGQYESVAVDENGQPVDENGDPVGEGGQPAITLRGLTAGKTYVVGVSTYKEQGEGDGKLCLFSGETLSAPLSLAAPTPTSFTVTADMAPVMVSQIGADGNSYDIPTYRLPTGEGEKLTLTLAASQAVTGHWYLDLGAGETDPITGETAPAAATGAVDQSGKVVSIPLSNLAQGEHTLRFQGKNAQGDGCLFEYVFAVDATPPKLVLGSPLNGSFFGENSPITVTGHTDPGAALKVSVNGGAPVEGRPTIAPDGSFTLSVALDPGKAVQTLTLTAADPAGNEARAEVALVSEEVANIKSLAIYNKGTGEDVSNKQLGGRTTTQAQLTLVGKLDDGKTLDLTGHPLVEWEALPAAGTATVDGTGNAKLGAHAKGIITAKLPVADGGLARVASTIFGDTHTNNLQPGAPDPAALEALLAQARGLDQNDYTAESWATLELAEGKAEEVLAKFDFTQEELDDAAQTLSAALQALRRKGGSSGSGVSTGDGGALITVQQPVPTPREPEPPTVGVILPSATVGRSGLVAVTVTERHIDKALAQARAAAQETGGVAAAVDLTGLKADFETLRVTLTQSAWAKLAGSEALRLELRTNQVSLWLDRAAIQAVQEQVQGDVTLNAARMGSAKLPADAQTAFGEGPAYQLSLTAGGGAVTSLGNGTGTLFLSWGLPAGQRGARFQMAQINAGQGLDYLTGSYYDKGRGTMEARVATLSTFGVALRPTPEFNDIQGHWAQADILAAASYGLLNGTGGGAFTPGGEMTRGMFVTALYRLAGFPQITGETMAFTDVPGDAYYAQAVAWAASRGVVKGTGTGTFQPDRPVTRQEMALIMTGYAQAMAVSLPALRQAVPFTDGDQIAPWAAQAVEDAQRAGLLSGKDGGRFDPAGTATRAEAAALLRRYVEQVIDPLG